MWDMTAIFTTLLLGALLFLPLETVLPMPGTRRRRANAWFVDLTHATIGAQLIKNVAALLLAAILLGKPDIRPAAVLPVWLQVIVLLLICDFIIYALHRGFHASPLLWRFHRIHHSSPHLDWLASARVHPVEQVIFAVATSLPMHVLGFSSEAIGIYLAAYQIHSALLHANTRLSFGPLEKVFTPPSFHHWHHADQVEAYDRNFGSQLVIWDKLLGTVHDAKTRHPERFGVNGPPRESFVAHLLAPFGRQPAAYADPVYPNEASCPRGGNQGNQETLRN